MAVAALGLIVAGAVYLKPSMLPPQAAPSAADRVPATASGWRLVSASFADSNHGTVELYRSGPAPTISFLTSDGGKTWHQVARSPENGLALAAFLDSRTVIVQTTSNLGPTTAGSIPGRTKTEVSFDGGRNWLELADPRLSRGPGLPGFLDPLHAWWIDRASSPSTDTPAAIWRTTDGGRS